MRTEMDEDDFEGTFVLEKLAAIGKVDVSSLRP